MQSHSLVVWTVLVLFLCINIPTEAHRSDCKPTQTVVMVTTYHNSPAITTAHGCQSDPTSTSIRCADLTAALALHSLTNKCIVLSENQTLSTATNVTAFTVNLTITSADDNKQTISVLQPVFLHFMHGENIHLCSLVFVNNFSSLLPDGYVSNSTMLRLVNINGLILSSIHVYFRLGYALQISSMLGDVTMKDINVTGVSHAGTHTSKGIYTEIFGDSPRVITIDKLQLRNLRDHFNNTTCLEHEHQACGKGAGMGIFFRSSSSNIAVDLSYGTFEGNKATLGAGLYVKFPKVSKNVTFRMRTCQFIDNIASYTGGGVLVMGVKDSSDMIGGLTTVNNTVTFSRIIFKSNNGIKGGGFSIWNLHSVGCMCQLSDSTFWSNTGFRGGDIYVTRSVVEIQNVNTSFLQCSYQMSGRCSSVNAFNSKLKIRLGNFSWHHGSSGVVLYRSILELDGALVVSHNTAVNGGGIALFSGSQVSLNNLSRLEISMNNATESGGGMYISSSYFDDCFFELPYNFRGQVSFTGNRSPFGSAVYSKTLRGCTENPEVAQSYMSVITTWPNFTLSCFNKNSSINDKMCVATDPIRIESDHARWCGQQPGVPFKFEIGTPDERGNQVDITLQLLVVDMDSDVAFSSDDRRKMIPVNKDNLPAFYGKELANFSMLIVASPYLLRKYTNLSLSRCSWFQQPDKRGACKCKQRELDKLGIVECSNMDGKLYLKPYKWVQTSMNDKVGSTYDCPKGYCFCDRKQSSYTVKCLYNSSRQCEKHRDQNSMLCSKCLSGFAVVDGDTGCHNCQNVKFGWLKVVVKKIGVDLAVVLVIVILNYDGYSAYLNPFIYSFRMMEFILREKDVALDPFILFVQRAFYRLQSNSKTYSCFTTKMDNLDKLWLDFGLASFWLVAYVLTYRLVEPCLYSVYMYVYDKCRHSNTKRLSKLLPRDSYYRSLTTIALIIYFEYVDFAFKALHYVRIGSIAHSRLRVYVYAEEYYCGGRHLPLFICAILLLLVITLYFVAMFLDCLSYECVKKCLHRCLFDRLPALKPYFRFQKTCFRSHDNFWLDRTWFLVLRYILFTAFLAFGEFYLLPGRMILLTTVCLMLLVCHVSLLPYKDTWCNNYETLVLSNLVIVGILASATDVKDDWQMQVISLVLVYVPLVVLIAWVVYSFVRTKCLTGRNIVPASISDRFQNSGILHPFHTLFVLSASFPFKLFLRSIARFSIFKGCLTVSYFGSTVKLFR